MKKTDDSTPGGRLRIARANANLTQKDLSSRTGVSQASISEFESGATADMDASKLVALCVAAGTTAEYVMRGVRSGASAEEAEAINLLRGASPAERLLAMGSLRGMLVHEPQKPTRPRLSLASDQPVDEKPVRGSPDAEVRASRSKKRKHGSERDKH